MIISPVNRSGYILKMRISDTISRYRVRSTRHNCLSETRRVIPIRRGFSLSATRCRIAQSIRLEAVSRRAGGLRLPVLVALFVSGLF
jgi:hypothetical protein